MAGSEVVIKTLRLRLKSGSPAPGREREIGERLSAALRGLELEPPGMPPSAVLLVRRLTRPVTGAPVYGRSADLKTLHWKAEAQREVAQAYAQASRPVQGELPADALAVLFSDPGELAAALVWEVANRTAPDRWWWQSLVSDPATLRELPKAFTREPRYIPAAVDHLIAWGRAERVALALTPSQARELAILMCEVYRLDRLLDVIRGDLDQPTDDNLLGAHKGTASAQSFSERSKTRGQGDRKGLAEGAFRDAVSTFDEGFPERFDREFDGRGDATKSDRSDAVWPDGAEADGQDPPSLYRSIGGGEVTPTVAKPPWRGSLASAPWVERLGRERAALLGMASAIVRKPSEAPGRGFAAHFETWWRTSSPPAWGGGMRPGVGQDAPETGGSDATVDHWLRDSEAATPSWGKDGPGEVTPPGGAGRRVPEGLDLDVRDEAHLGPQSSEPLDRVGSLGPGGSRPGAQGEWDAPLASGESGASVGLGERGRGPAPNEAASKANAETTFEEMEEKKAREQAREKAEAEIGGADERLREPASPAVGFGSGHTGGPRKGEDSELVAATDANSSHLQRRGEACETALGGVLYLLNVMKQLRLPDSFEADWALDSHLGAWGCLQAIAIGLLAASGCTGGAMASTERRIPIVDPTTVWSDPIWRLLAELDGREPGQPLGANVIDPGVFVTPLEWNKWVGQGGLGRGVAASVIDAGKGAFPISAALLKWIASATPYINEFVRIAAGPLGTAELDPASLLFVRASVYASATHVDMVAGLDEISLAARIAGLDRDPGWDPKCARVVQFYFR